MKLRITIEGKSYEVDVEILEDYGAHVGAGAAPVYTPPAVASAPPPVPSAPAPAPKPSAAPSAGAKSFPSPLAGTVRAINVKPGDSVAKNQEMIIMEAMKMETAISAAFDGKVKAVLVNVGDAVQAGQALIEFE